MTKRATDVGCLAVAKMSTKCDAVLFSVTLAPTPSQFLLLWTQDVVLRVDEDRLRCHRSNL